jgi:glucose/arabinose dehydrogenase
VSSPSTTTAAGHTGGRGEIVVLSDDNRDGTAEIHTFARGGLETVHGLDFSNGFLYFTTTDGIYRSPYASGQRAETPGSRQTVVGGPATALGAAYQRGGRWTHGLGASVNGRILATRGEYSSCMIGPDGRSAPGIGEVYEVATGALNRVASGFRNPMYARCHSCRDLCMVTEMGEDQTTGAVETLVVINNNQWFGYPCCFQRTTGPQASTGLCACMDEQQIKINLGDSPFGFDWERGAWPEPYRNGVFIALHGSFYLPNYQGAGIMFLPTDPATGVPRNVASTRFLEATNGTGRVSLERPSDIRFTRDGRMLISDDKGGAVYWVAPTTWRM